MIYLDYNLFSLLHANEHTPLRDKVSHLSSKYNFPYSPAHMEDIATGSMGRSKVSGDTRAKYAISKANSIAEISKNCGLLPSTAGPIKITNEPAEACLVRVLEKYYLNDIVEKFEKQMIKSFKENDKIGEIAKITSNLPPDFLLNSDFGRELKRRLHFDSNLIFTFKRLKVKGLEWAEISKEFPAAQRAIEIAMNYLEEIRYHPDKVKNSNSRTHDISHAIYATACKYFVTQDTRLYHKVKSVYKYLGVPTTVLTLEEFIALDFA